MNNQKNEYLNVLEKARYMERYKLGSLKDRQRELDKLLNSEVIVNKKDDFDSDLEYKEFMHKQNELKASYQENKVRIERTEAKMKHLDELINQIEHDSWLAREAERDNRLAKEAEQTIPAHDEEELESDRPLSFIKFTSDQFNIDETSNRIVEDSASMKMEASVSNYIDNAENGNLAYLAIFGLPVHTTGF